MASDRPEPNYRGILLSLVGSLTMCDHMGDVGDYVEVVMKRLALDLTWHSRDELALRLGQMGVKTLYGTELADPTPAAPDQAEGPDENRGDDVPSVTSRAEESVMDKGVFRYDTDKTRLGAPLVPWDPSHREIL